MHTHTLTYNATRTSLESGHTIQLVHRCDITNLSQRWDLPAYRIHPDSQVSPRVDPRLRPCTSARRGRSEGASQRETRPDRRAARESSEHEIVRLCAYIWQDALQNTIVSDEYTTVQRRNTIASIGHAERGRVLRRTTCRFEDRDGPTEANQHQQHQQRPRTAQATRTASVVCTFPREISGPAWSHSRNGSASNLPTPATDGNGRHTSKRCSPEDTFIGIALCTAFTRMVLSNRRVVEGVDPRISIGSMPRQRASSG